MAGAGYKLFNTGDVLTAAQVNTYLMEQSVMVFADAAARTTALTGVVAEGMLSYLKDTNAVEVYNGSAWVASDDPNAIQNTIVDAKGDLIAASAADTPARLAVGNNGETLVADSSASTGLRYQNNFAAGKNKIINGAFNIWQRGTSFNIPAFTVNVRAADRFQGYAGSGTATMSQQTFTPGAAPVAGYESQYFFRYEQTISAAGSGTPVLDTRMEDVRTLAGQTVTVSFYAKAGAALTLSAQLEQNFGSGGSSTVATSLGSFSVTTSWARYSATISVPSISGKTLGSSSYLSLTFIMPTTGTFIVDYWGVQVEAGSVATAFNTATGTLAGELAACQRYFQRAISGANTNERLTTGACISTSAAEITYRYVNTMRVSPTLSVSNVSHFILITNTGGSAGSPTAISGGILTPNMARVDASGAANLVGGDATSLQSSNASSTLDFSAEL